MIRLLLTGLLAAAPAATPPNGVYFEQTTLVRQPGRAPGAGVRSRVWSAGARMRLEPADAALGFALLLRLDEGRVLRLDADARVATELDVERLRARSHADAAVAAGLLGAPPDEELRVRPLAGTRTLAGHACRGFRIAAGTATVEAWVAADLPLRADLFADFVEWSGAGQALPGLIRALRALPGFPLETAVRLSVLGELQETVSTVTAIRVERVAAERFEVPRGWRVVQEPAEEERR